ncbi:MAG: 23S rRNA (guanosine(2251)-2'-O)-methyltransferase RlmB [Clostridiaceae bacterium]|nr:23S rRNA (guanosine(2251)-2'-O)-methyltransferase RlmB [Clostridiaceae bacterium]
MKKKTGKSGQGGLRKSANRENTENKTMKKGTGKGTDITGHVREAAHTGKDIKLFNETDYIDREDRVEGKNSVFEAIRSGRPLNKLFVEKDSQDVLVLRIIAMAREKDIPIQYLERNKLDAISQTRAHQGVILEVAAKEYVGIDDIMKAAEEKGEKPFVLVLDGITDPNNLGSIIRSAECAGVHGIILPKRRSAALNATVAKVAAGALEYVNVARVTNLVQTLRTLKNEGLWVIGADMAGEVGFQDADLTGPIAVVIGSEGEGLSRLVKSECDIMVKIPMKGVISSLNAGVAAGIMMFEVLRQRGF